MEVGERIRIRREQLGMTQSELAKKVGYTSRSSVAKVESNANGMVQSKLVAIAEALQTTPAYLLGWEEMEKKNDAIADIILKLRSDNNFLEFVVASMELTPEQFAAAKNLLLVLKEQNVN